MGLGDFSAIDLVSGAANPFSTVTIRNGSVALVGGNWDSGAVNVIGGSTVIVGHTDPVTGNLVAQTGNFDTYGERVVVTGSDVTVLGDWASGDVVITGNSDVSVGMWNPVTMRPVGNGNMTITGDFSLTGATSSSFRAAGTITADNVVVTNSQNTIIGGGLTVFEDILVTGSTIGVGGNATAQNLVLSTTTANITGDVTVGNAFGHGTTLLTTSGVTIGGNLITDTLLISNTATNATQIGKNVTVDGAARIYGGTVSVTGDWNSGRRTNIPNPTTTLRNDVVLDGTRLSVMGDFSTNNDAATAMRSIVTVGKNWNSGITTLTNTEANVGVNFNSGALTVTGTTASGNNLLVGGSLDVDGQVVIASVSGAAPTSVSVARDWTSGNVYTSGSNSRISVGQDWQSSAINTDGGSFTIGGNMTTDGASINSNHTGWNVVTGNWNSGNVTLGNGYADVGGNFTAGDVRLTNVTRMETSGNWNSDVVSSSFASADGESVFEIGGNWHSGQLTISGGSNIGRFIVGGDATFAGSVRTTSMDLNVAGNWNAGGNLVDVRTANSVSTQNWTSGTTSLTDVTHLAATGNWTSDSLHLDAGGMDMSISGNFNPGSALGFGMQTGVNLNSLSPVYNIIVGGNTNLGGTLLSVTGANNLLANGRYYISSITSTGGTINADGLRVSDMSLFKKVAYDINDTETQLDVYVDSQGFASYAARQRELGLGKLSHNQLEVVSNLARAEQNITDFEVAATSQVSSFNAVTTSPMRDNAVVKDVLDRLVSYGDNETIAVNTRATKINRAISQLSGETYANSMLLASTRPWMSALDRTRLDNSIYFTGSDYATDMQAVRGQARSIAKMNRVWITPEYSFDALSDDGNARGANIGRLGFSMGLDRRIRQNATAGLLFGFNNGRLSQDDDRFQAGDFQIGAYASAMVGYYIELRSFLGCGWQNYESNRVVDLTFAGGTRRAAAGRANGQSFSGTLEAARPLFFGVFILKPTVALDVSSYTRDAFTETGDSIRLNVGRTTYTRVAPKVGATWETDPMKRFAATTRVFAGYNLGDDHVTAKTQFVSFGGASQSVHSTVIGRLFLDTGLGARYHANAARTMSFHGNVDIMAASNSFSGAVSLGGTWMY